MALTTLSQTHPSGESDADSWTLTLDLANLWRGVLLLLATIFSHWQAIGGGFIWDDDAHVTRVDLRSFEGLFLIWTKLGATQQYYPLLHSIFWFEHALWGDNATLYHIVNIVFHTVAVFLLVFLLRKLVIPGAWVAGFIFALHPVYVESIAWVTEQKNTISAIFYLLAAINYIKYDQERKRNSYLLGLVFFVLALLSKTVTATLPAALLVIFWWQRGTITFKRDVVPLLPWFVLGIVGGCFTAWVERVYIGANGTDFALTPVMRCLLAGRVVWFYLGKLLWPANLIFIYEHWNIDSSSVLQYFYPVALIALVAALYLNAVRPFMGDSPSRFSRAPLAGFLFFVGTLFPVLGFANVYPFMFSYVADHFQYLGSLGIIVPLAAFCTISLEKLSAENRGIGSAVGGVMLGLLGVLSWQQCSMYESGETLYKTTLEKNPSCWMAHNNLGAILLNQGKGAEAEAHFVEALHLRTLYADAQSNLTSILIRTGRYKEAVDSGIKSLKLRETAEAENSLAIALANTGRYQEAISHYLIAIRIKPNFFEALNNVGNSYMALRRFDDAFTSFQAAIKLAPNYAEAYDNFSILLLNLGRKEDALKVSEHAVQLIPNAANFRSNLGLIYASVGRASDALAQYTESARLNPNVADVWYNIGNTYANLGKYTEAEVPYINSLKLNPNNMAAMNNLAAVCFKLGRTPEAIGYYNAALRLNPDYPEAHSNLGVALAGAKLNAEAILEYEKAIKLKPDYSDAYNNYGLALMANGQTGLSLAKFKEAIRLNTSNPEYHENLGRAFIANGQKILADREFAEAKRLRTPVVGPVIQTSAATTQPKPKK